MPMGLCEASPLQEKRRHHPHVHTTAEGWSCRLPSCCFRSEIYNNHTALHIMHSLHFSIDVFTCCRFTECICINFLIMCLHRAVLNKEKIMQNAGATSTPCVYTLSPAGVAWP